MAMAAVAGPACAQTPPGQPDMKNPASMAAHAPDTYKAKFETSAGDFVIEVTRAWSPLGADRFYNLVRAGFFTDVRFFRAVKSFMIQFGIHGDPTVTRAWRSAKMADDPPSQPNKKGYITYANAGPGTRGTQLFINLVDNAFLNDPRMAFTPFGRVISGMEAVEKINTEYGDFMPPGRGPDPGRLESEGNAFLIKEYSRLDYIKKATIIP
jgi:peptidyl-prolyl cis-trans isomerase A (cyclophilin A)